MSSPSQPSSGSEPQPARPESAQDKSGIDAATDVEIQRRFNELKREFLDHRVKLVDWWLTVTAGFLTLLGVVAVIAGYFSFQRFDNIETKAEGHMKTAKEHAEEAERLVNRIRGKYAELENLDAESIGKNLAAALREAESVQEDPTASLIDQAIAAAVQLQGQEKIEAAIEMWRYIAKVPEGIDNQLRARAWFSVGYLLGEEEADLEAAIDAYDKALDLKPDYAEAYNNRGVAKNDLRQYEAALTDLDEAMQLKPATSEIYNNRGNAKRGLRQHQAALADYTEAIRLKPDSAEAYNNRGVAKNDLRQYEAALVDLTEALRLKPKYANAHYNRGIAMKGLDRLNEAREAFQKALALAQESGNESLIARVQRNLSQFDKGEAP